MMMMSAQSSEKPARAYAVKTPKLGDGEAIWTPAQVAKVIGYATETVRHYSTQHPERLPPRIAGMAHPRWLRSVVLKWLKDRSRTVDKPEDVPTAPAAATQAPKASKRGRPRRTPAR